jgi:hypothetical protein
MEEQMKRTKSIIAVMLTLALVLAFVPMTAHAGVSTGTVTVTVTNATFDGAPSDRQGEFMREEVALTSGMTVEDAINQACNNAEIAIVYNSYGIIESIGGLGQNPEALASGWFCAINNWFADTGTSDIEAQDGDWISLEYTNGISWDVFGADVGSVWGDYTKTLKSLNSDFGNLTPAFSSDKHDYTLTLPEGTDNIVVSPLATNRNFIVKTFVGETEYKLFDEISVSKGTQITIICGDPTWPSMNKPDSVEAETYTITIAYEAALDGEEVIATDDSPKTGDSGMLLPLAMLFSLSTIAMAVTARRRHN